MKRVLLVISAMLLVIGASVPAAWAGPISVGDPFVSSSWEQAFVQSGAPAPGTFDKLEWFIVGGTYDFDFETTGFKSLSISTWTASRLNADYALATGPFATSINFNGHFSGLSGNGTMETIWMTWRGSQLIEFGSFNKNAGNAWTWTSLSTAAYDPGDFNRSVPDGGATLALLGGALVGLGALRRKFRG